MDDRQRYIGILETAAGLLLEQERLDIEKMIDRRIFNNAAAGAIRLGVPVRVSDDGLFLTIDLGGRSYTVIASAVESALREDYDRALNMCRLIAGEQDRSMMAETPSGRKPAGENTGSRDGGEKERISGPRLVSSGPVFSEEGRNTEPPRFQSRLSAKRMQSVSDLADPGNGDIPADLPFCGKKFSPAGENGSGESSADRMVVIRYPGQPGRKDTWLFRIFGRPAGPGSVFAAVKVTVTDPDTNRKMAEAEGTGELFVKAGSCEFKVIGVIRNGNFCPGIMLKEGQAADRILEVKHV